MRSRHIALVVIALVGATLVASCGGNEVSAPPPTTTTTTTATTATADARLATGARRIRVGLVTAAGSDALSLNALARSGLRRAEQQLGVDGRVLVSTSRSTHAPQLSSLAARDYDLVIAVGPPLADAVASVAKRFRNVDFAIVDVSQAALPGKQANVRGLRFKEQEAGYLAGYLAGLVNAEESSAKHVIGSVGGRKIPSVDRYIAGFRAGARKANPRVTTLNAYSESFVDQARCKEIALDQIARGADVIFQVARQCGLGALAAAKERNVRGVGVDVDQAYLGPHILTSAVKKVDVAVFETIRAAQDGSFTGGHDTVFDVASGGVGLGRIAADVPGEIVAKVKQMQAQIAAGTLARIPDNVR